MKKILFLMALATAVFAVDVQKCTVCHGTTFEKSALNKSKVVSEMTVADVKTALHGYIDGTYGGNMKALMKSQLTAYAPADLDAIAEEIGK